MQFSSTIACFEQKKNDEQLLNRKERKQNSFILFYFFKAKENVFVFIA